MQRQSSSALITVSFIYSRGSHEAGEIVYEDLSTPEHFSKNYIQLCQDKTENIDRQSFCFPAPAYKIKLSGSLSGNSNFEKTFCDLNEYHLFLQRHKLWEQSCVKTRKI